MRYQDRLLKLCPPPRPLLGQFVAREMEGLVLYFDSEEVLRALRAMELAGADLAGTQAALALCRLAPLHHRAAYLPSATPVQSRLMDSDQLQAPVSMTDSARMARQANQETYRRAATMLLDGLVDPVLGLTRTATGRRRRRAIRLLALLQNRRGLQHLQELGATTSDADAPLACLLAAGSHGASSTAVLDAVRRDADSPQFAPLILSLGAAPSPEALRVLAALTTCGNVDALAAAAAALEGFPAEDAEPLLERLCRDGFGWATVNALESIGRLRSPRALDLVVRTYRRLDHPTLRAAAAKVAGNFSDPRAREFLAEILDDRPEASVAARALEGLVRFSGGAARYAKFFEAYATHANAEAAVAAVVGLCATDRQRVARQLRSWLLESEPAWRTEAAYCLGYVQGDFAASLLGKLATSDPDEGVRLQASRSLALFGWSPISVGVLSQLLESGDAAVRRAAASVLGNPALAEDRDVYAKLVRTYQAEPDGEAAATMARALGATGSGLAKEYLTGQARTQLDPGRMAGVLEGLDLAGTVSPSVWRPLLSHGSPAVRAAATRLAWHGGDDEGVPVLAEILASGSDDAEAAMDEAERMLLTCSYLADEPRFTALREKLREALHSRSYREFAAEEFSVHLSPDRLPKGYDPFADPALARPWDASEAQPLAGAELLSELEQARSRSRRRKRTRSAEPLDALDRRISVFSPGRIMMASLLFASLVLLASGTYRNLSSARATPASQPLVARPGQTVVPAALQVVGLAGGARVELASGPPLRALPGTTLRGGCRFLAGASSAVMLVGPSGRDRIRVLPETNFRVAEVTWDRAGGATRIALDSLAGSLVVEVEAARTDLSMAAGAGKVSIRKGTSHLRGAASTLTVQVASGRVEVAASGSSQVTILTEGQELELADGKASTPGTCEPKAVLDLLAR
ncbi:MAG: HEAT repeat domain-containing protein [Candidatus Wallbacteria bacterium]|nr:HEAT repeat domain-containing protein [Candidatus Wallbacteria bacterium]